MAYSIVFPGQGSQRTGMGQDFASEFPTAKNVFQEASEAIGEDLEKICFEEDERINLTEFTQPAILVTEVAMYRVLQEEMGVQGDYFAGHSLGEYTALVAAGVLDLASAAKIVRKRGALMQAAVPAGVGAMAALIQENISDTDYKVLVDAAGAEVANFNSKDQTVISGKKEAVEAACKSLGEKFPGMNIVPLTVSAPFHSSLMKPIEKEFAEFLQGFAMNTSKSEKVLSNFTGTFHEKGKCLENLVSQISGSVDWIANMKALIAKGNPILEVGPNRPLGKFFLTLGAEVPSVINVRAMKKNLQKVES